MIWEIKDKFVFENILDMCLTVRSSGHAIRFLKVKGMFGAKWDVTYDSIQKIIEKRTWENQLNKWKTNDIEWYLLTSNVGRRQHYTMHCT